MKKLFAVLLVVAMLASMATVVSAAENTTTLTTTVLSASYTLNIPANQNITYGATETDIGTITITESENFAAGKNVDVSVVFDGSFKCQDASTTIPYQLKLKANDVGYYKYDTILLNSNDTVTFKGLQDKSVSEKATASFPYTFTGGSQTETNRDANVDALLLCITSEDWGKALAGEYTATITFTTEVVVE